MVHRFLGLRALAAGKHAVCHVGGYVTVTSCMPCVNHGVPCLSLQWTAPPRYSSTSALLVSHWLWAHCSLKAVLTQIKNACFRARANPFSKQARLSLPAARTAGFNPSYAQALTSVELRFYRKGQRDDLSAAQTLFFLVLSGRAAAAPLYMQGRRSDRHVPPW